MSVCTSKVTLPPFERTKKLSTSDRRYSMYLTNATSSRITTRVCHYLKKRNEHVKSVVKSTQRTSTKNASMLDVLNATSALNRIRGKSGVNVIILNVSNLIKL